MTEYFWGASGGDFGDANNWINGDDNKRDDGVPGGGDTGDITGTFTVTAGGQTVGNLTLSLGVTIAGDITVTDTLGGGVVAGTAQVGTLSFSTFTGAKLTADTVTNSHLEAGEVHVGTLSEFNVIAGADVTADSVTGNNTLQITSGSLHAGAVTLLDENILDAGGTATFASLTVGGAAAPHLAGVEVAAGGQATVTGATSLGSGSFVNVGKDTLSGQNTTDGGTMNFQGGLTVQGPGSSVSVTSWTGAVLNAAGAVVVDMTNAHASNVGLVADGGTMNFTGTLTLGKTLEGDLNLVDGGKATVKTLVAGAEKGSSGDIFADGQGVSLTASGAVTVGEAGTGSLTVGDGAHAWLKSLVLGGKAGGSGTANVTGKGSELDVADTVTVGEKGTGSLSIQAGTVFDPADVVIAGVGAPTGGPTDPTTGFHTQNISGVGVLGDMTTGDLTLGEAGYGQLRVFSPGTVTTEGDGKVGERKGSEGQVVLNGGHWTVAGELTVGAAGKALVEVGAGGRLAAQGGLSLGEEKGGSGKIVLGDGSAGSGPGVLVGRGAITIGGAGSGTLVSDESTINFTGRTLTLGEEAGSKGTLTVHGGTLTFGGEMVVGAAGKGTATFNQGASLAAAAGNHAASLTLGEKVGGTGTVTFDGKGTAATMSAIEDGVLGKGTINIAGGATVTAASADLATQASTNANGVTVNTAGRFVVTGDLAVGEKGFGTLSVKGAGQVTASGEVAIGEDTASIGSATISGTVTDKTTHKTTASHLGYGALVVGEGGSGSLTINGGATVGALGKTPGTVEIATEVVKGVTDKLTLTDKGSALSGKSLAVGGTAETAGGKASLTVSNDATATFKTASIWKSGAVTLNGGTLHVTGAVEGNGAITIGKAGTLILGGHDEKVGVSFAAAGHGVLSLGAAAVLDATIKGFAKTDSIKIGGLDTHATITVKADGADTDVAIHDHGKVAGDLTLAGHYTAAQLHFAAATGVLTTTAAAPATAAVTGGLIGSAAGPSEGAVTASHDSAPGAVDRGDTFVFAGPLTGHDVERIADFTSGVDRIELDHAVFAGLGDGPALAAVHFVADADGLAHTRAQHVVYDTATGALSYDADGSGPGAAIHFATLAGHPCLTAGDFLVA
ncbi:MAG TPA: hypothetical protein VHD15_00240 [Hyphomicrobiales bacterium]|nr:hypothetical protein [Hyphomicrobiales bacterium]